MTAVIFEEETEVEETNNGVTPDIKDAADHLLSAGDDIKGLVTVFKLLSDETRLKILFILREADEMNVLELCRILGQRQPSVSHHLALLRVNGLIGMRRDGKHNFYHIRLSRLDEVVETVLKVSPGRGNMADATEIPDKLSRNDASASQ